MQKSLAKKILFLVIGISAFLWLKPFENEISMKNEHRETGGKQAQEFFEQMIRNPKTGKIPMESLVSISNKMQKDARSSRKANLSKGVATTIWQERGGSNIQGRLKCIMIDKRDVTGNTLIVGSDTGGLWKTTNAMSDDPTWNPINDFMGFLHTQSVFQNPANLNEIYCTTGNISWVSPETAGVGLYKSTDGGDTWNHLTATNNGNFKHSGNVVVNSSGVIFVATHEGGIQRSSNGGLTWSKVLGSGVGGGTTNQILDLDLATNGTLYATAKDKKVYKSSDNGNSWTNISIPGLTTNDYLIRLAVAPSDPNKVYAFVEWSKNFLSTNGGVSWTRVGDMSINAYGSPDGCITMEVDPNNSNRIYAGGINYNASSNSGTSWSRITGDEVHVDAHAITFLSSNVAFIGNDGGIYRTDNASSTNPTFKFIGNGLNTLQYYNIDIHPEAYKDYFLGGTQDNGTQRSTGAGITSSENVLGGDGGFAFIDEDQPNIQIAAYQNEGGAYTTDNWNSSKYVGYAPANQAYFITPKDYDDVNNRLYTCMSIANSYSVTTGIGIVDPVTVSTKTINAMNGGSATCAMVSPNDPNIVYFGCGNGALVKVVNPTATTPTATRIMDGAYGWISSIAIEPGNENHIIATYSSFGVNHVVETKNGGNSWMDISNNFPDMPVYNGIFAPNDTNKFILATHLGVWMTENLNGANTNWVSFNDGLSNVIVRMVKARKSDGVVVAGTHGRGLFTTNYFLQSNIAPSTPGTVFATNATSTSLSLTWEASIDDLAVTGYDVYDGTTLLASVNTNSAEITGLSPDTTYSLTVKAKDGQGNISNPSSPALITTAATNSVSSNIALKASNVTTSFVSGWESLAAVNDGFVPANSGDRTHNVYGNWDTHNTFQWVRYDWSQNYEITSVELYWFTDNGGILIPTEAFVEYYNGSAWVKLADVTLNANQFNIATFNTINASSIRVSMKNTTQSTGIIEFKVIGKIASNNMSSNIALNASNVTTSFVSGWESLAAVNDGFIPTNSGDRTHSVYGNWDTRNTFQWVQYDWSQNYEITSVELYWFTDNGGILIPTEAFVEYYNGSAWVKLADVTLNANQFNIATFNTINTNNIRVSMKNTTQSTGIIEFRVIGKIASGNALSKLGLSKKLTKSVSVYPNPTSNKITLRLGDLATSGQLNLSILDVSGKLIWSKKTEGKNEIALYTQDMKLSKGVYLLRVSNTEVVQTIKIIISR